MKFLKSHWRETLVLFLCLLVCVNFYFTFRLASFVVALNNNTSKALAYHEEVLKQIIQSLQGSPM